MTIIESDIMSSNSIIYCDCCKKEIKTRAGFLQLANGYKVYKHIDFCKDCALDYSIRKLYNKYKKVNKTELKKKELREYGGTRELEINFYFYFGNK